jgi:hypothetical protein
MSKSSELFPAIGQVADQTESIETKDVLEGNTTADEEKVVDEIDSLCMKCHEQVSPKIFSDFTMVVMKLFRLVGENPNAPDLDSLFQRGRRNVVPLRTLWVEQ